MLRLRNHLLPLLRAASPLPFPLHQRACPLFLLSTSTSPAPFSLENYLVATCGLSPAQARKASQKALAQASKDCKKLSGKVSRSRLYSASNSDAVLALLSGVGLARADIAAIVNADPLILRSTVSSITPRLLSVRDRVGLSAPQIARFLLVGSRALRICDVAPKLEFFISFYGSFEKLLVTIKRNNSFLTSDLERVIKPNIAYLRKCGLSVRDIVQMCSCSPRVLTYNPERVKEFVLRAGELGVPRSSKMFKYAVAVATCVSKRKLAAKLQVLRETLGCSEADVAIAVSRMPSILGISEETLRRKIQFLINEVGMEPQYIVERPALFGLSLEKRLVPRYCVMKILQAKGLLNSNMSFYSLATIKEETFKLKFVNCHKESVPALADTCAAACAGDVPLKVQL